MDLSSRLRAIVKGGLARPNPPALSEQDVHSSRRELTYEPDTGRYEASTDLDQVGALLGGRPVDTPFGRCLIVDRRYEADRCHGQIRIGDCEVDDFDSLAILDPSLTDSFRGLTPVPRVRPRSIRYGLCRGRSLSISRRRGSAVALARWRFWWVADTSILVRFRCGSFC